MYKPINGWTKASMLDHIRTNFRGKSLLTVDTEDGGAFIHCAYRGDNGAKCAVGMFIPDAKYSAIFEGATVSQILGVQSCPRKVARPDLYADMPLDSIGMWRLQGIHDSSNETDTLDAMTHWINTNVED